MVTNVSNEDSLVLDHVLVAVDDLAGSGDKLWHDNGLACAVGGHRLEMGTANRPVPRGSA
jgi:hypothetical protein